VGQGTTIARKGPIAALFSVLGENGAAELHVVYTQLTTVEPYRRLAVRDGAVLLTELYEAHAPRRRDQEDARPCATDAARPRR
jgi:hypothetical protein